MLNKKEKLFKYVFSETDIDKFLHEPEKVLSFESFITLIIDTNSDLTRISDIGTHNVFISKYTKDNKLIHSEKIKLPVSNNTNFEDYLLSFSQGKPPKPEKEKNPLVSDNKTKKVRKSLEHLPMQTVTLIGFTVLTICVLGTGLTINHSINKANAQKIKLSQEMLLSQLESDKRYDRVAQKMKAFDYSQKEIADMYIENGKFINALKADSTALKSVLQKIDTQDAKEQMNSLETIKKADLLEKEQSLSLDLRLALLNQDTDYLSKNKKNIDSQELADSIVKYFASEKKYEEAITILSDFPNDDLEKVIAKEATDYHVKQLEDALDSAKEAVKEKQSTLDAKNQQISDLGKQLDDINKNEGDKDKGTHAEEKQKEIDTAKNEQENLSSELAELKKTQEQAQKSLDDSTKK